MNEYEDKLQEQQEDIPSVPVAQEKPKKTVHDWLRDLRMSSGVNKTTVGVETDRVTPELLLATSNKLIAINKGKAEPDAKDSLEFQRIYGPTDFFAEHVLRDAGRTGRQLLWKATNRGNIDFMPTAALDSHVSDVFNASKLANMVDASSPMESIEASFKVSRIGEGGVASQDSAPTEMRLVQPSFLGFIDPVATPESFRVGLDDFMTKNCMKGSDGKLYQTFIDARTGKRKLLDSVTAAKAVVTTPDMMESEGDYCYAVGGKTGVRIVKKSDVDYFLPNMDDAFTNAANLVPGLSGVKELRLRMGCLHPLTSMVVYDGANNVTIVPAKELVNITPSVPGADEAGADTGLQVRTVAARLPVARSWFRKVVLTSGRTLITSKDHRWYAGRKGKWSLMAAEKLKPGDQVMRTLFSKMPGRKTFVNHLLVTRAMGLFFGYLVRGLSVYPDGSFFFTYEKKKLPSG